MRQRAWFQSSAILGASFFNSARRKCLFSERLIVSDELLVLQWRSRIFVQKLILFNFYPFWHISFPNNVARKWVIRDSPPWGESCVPLAKMLPRKFLIYKSRALLTNHEANLARFWLSSFLFTFLWTETELRSIKTRKRTSPVSIPLDRRFGKSRIHYMAKKEIVSRTDHRIRFILTGRKTASHIM